MIPERRFDMAAHTFKRDKFKELVLYLSERSEADPNFGETKLNKLLFYIDLLAYRELGRPVTGAKYQKLRWGPAATALLPIQQEMEALGDLKIRPGLRGAYTQKKPIALRQANLGAFTGAEIALVDQLIAALWNLGAVEVSDLSHDNLGWQLAQDREEIPYETVFVESIEVVHAATAAA
jgi:Protein of unknown function (DUF4065)